MNTECWKYIYDYLFCRSVYLSGGVTTIPGFADRLQEELKKLSPPSVVVEVDIYRSFYHF